MTPENPPPPEETPDDDFELDLDLDLDPGTPPPATWAGRERAGAGGEEAPDEPTGEEQPGLGQEEPAEEPPAEEVPAEEPPAEETRAEEVPAEEPPTEEEAVEEEPGEAEPAAPAEQEPEASLPPPPPPATVRDRRHSTDAALAGLRARTAGKPASAAPPATLAATGRDDGDEAADPPRAKPMWARFLAASLIIVISMATATSVSALVLLTDISGIFGGIPGIEKKLTPVEGGDPQTILILGSDKRPTDATGRSDTTILLRVNPDQKAISLFSIPRDLKVEIPNHGTQKFNAAYSYGGPPLTLQVVEQLTGIDVNHVVNINFNGFADTVDAIGCVYIDADRRYYIAPESGIAEIDIEAGYQRMCGLKALQYVRYRHTDTDLVRAARQQDFLREARQKIEPSKLAFDPGYRTKLLKIFGEYTTSDNALQRPIQVLELMKTFVAAQSAPINDVPFPAQTGPVYVTADKDAIAAAVDEFMGADPPAEPSPGDEGDGGEKRDPEQPRGGEKKPKPDPEPKPEPPEEGPAMVDVTGAAKQYAAAYANQKTKGGDPMIEFPIRYPTLLTEGSTVDDEGRAFVIDGPGTDKYYGYKFVAQFPGDSGYTEYYGVSGTNWKDPPILANPSETREISGREYLLFYDADRLRLVGWKQKNASYWVINTLTQTLAEAEMLEIVTSLAEYDG
jgi:LCP family protein required for cell wall assembly